MLSTINFRFLFILFLTVTLFSACKTRQKTISTVPTVVKPMEDKSVQDLLAKIELNRFNATWMNGKASVTTNENGSSNSFNINLRFKRDSVIWISISPLLGIEVARVMITPDSIKFMDRIHGKYDISTFEYINKVLQLKVNFEMLQSILTGNFFAYRKNENRFNSVYMEDKFYILSSLNKKKLKRSLEEIDPNKSVVQDVYIEDEHYRITKIKVVDQKIAKNLETQYSDFRPTDGGLFPYRSDTKIDADKKFEIAIDFSKINVGETQEFPFTIPKSYDRNR